MSKPKPKPDDLKMFVDEFKIDNDRAAVVLGAAKIDELLYKILGKFLKPPAKKDEDILDSDGPLGTFSARIHAVQRLGLLDDTFCRALHLIRKIRNGFAHVAEAASLNQDPHRNRVIALVFPIEHTKQYQGVKGYHFQKPINHSQAFKACLVIIVARLSKAYSTTECLEKPTEPLPFLDPECKTVKLRPKTSVRAINKRRPLV